MKRFVVSLSVVVLALCTLCAAQDNRRFTVDDLLKVRRVGDPQVSPKSDLVAYTITDIDKAANHGVTQIYLVPIGGGAPAQPTNNENSPGSPRWTPDGRKLAFPHDDPL